MGEKLQLKDVCEIKTGKLDANAMTVNGKYPFFTCDPQPSRIDKYAYDCECVLIGGNNANGNFPINYFEGKFNAYQRTYIITMREESNIPLSYIYYLLSTELKQLKRRSAGSLTKFLTMGALEKISIPILNTKDYNQIGSQLYFYENAISHKEELINNLEEYAQLLFHKWFVDFNFPDKNGNPYKDSKGEMVEVYGKMIPKEWEIKAFKDLFAFEKGVIPESISEKNDGSLIPYLTIEFLEENKGQFTEKNDRLTTSNDLDTLMVMDGSRSGKVFTGINGYVGSTLAKVQPKQDKYKHIGHFYLKMRESHISKRTTGSTVPHTSKTYVNSLLFAIPTHNEMIKKLNENLVPLREKVALLKRENQLLAETRNLLIKKLIK